MQGLHNNTCLGCPQGTVQRTRRVLLQLAALARRILGSAPICRTACCGICTARQRLRGRLLLLLVHGSFHPCPHNSLILADLPLRSPLLLLLLLRVLRGLLLLRILLRLLLLCLLLALPQPVQLLRRDVCCLGVGGCLQERQPPHLATAHCTGRMGIRRTRESFSLLHAQH